MRKSILPKKSGGLLPKKKKGLNDPDIDSMFMTTGLPGLPPINETDVEAIANQETDDIMTLIRDNRRSYAENFRDIEAGEFWSCVCFQSRSQRDEFIANMLAKYAPHTNIDKFGAKYISGLELADMLGVAITPIKLEVKKNRLAPKSLRRTEVIS